MEHKGITSQTFAEKSVAMPEKTLKYFLYRISFLSAFIDIIRACGNQGFQPRTGAAINPFDVKPTMICPPEKPVNPSTDILSKINYEMLNNFKNFKISKIQSVNLCTEFKSVSNLVDLTCTKKQAKFRSIRVGSRRGKRSPRRNFRSFSISTTEKQPNLDIPKNLNELFIFFKKSTVEKLLEYNNKGKQQLEHEFSVFFRSSILEIQSEFEKKIIKSVKEKDANNKCLIELKTWAFMCRMLKADFLAKGVLLSEGDVTDAEFCEF